MSRPSLLIAIGAASALAWIVVASTAFLWITGSTWFGLQPGPFWSSRYFAHGVHWTWAWFSYALNPSTRARFGSELAYSAAGAAVVVGITVFRLVQLCWTERWSDPSKAVYGKTEWADRKQMRGRDIAASKHLP